MSNSKKNSIKNNLKTGTVCLVKFHPSTGSELKRYRPAVIASEKITALDSRFALVIPFITNTKNYDQKTELLIEKNNVLDQDSVLLCWYLRVIDLNRIETVLGRISATEIKQMKAKIKQLFV